MTNHPLDRIDRAILDALQNDARLSNKELAARVGLAPSSCLERVRRLRERGILRAAHYDVDPEALGVGLQAIVYVRLRSHSRAVTDRFRDDIVELDEVVALYEVAGRHDYLVFVAVRDPTHLRDLRMDAFTSRDEVAHIETALVFDHHRRTAWPDYLDET